MVLKPKRAFQPFFQFNTFFQFFCSKAISSGLNRISLPEISFQALIRPHIEKTGVSDSIPNSISILLLEKLSTIKISCPKSERCNAVGQPQKPPPPKTIILITPSTLKNTVPLPHSITINSCIFTTTHTAPYKPPFLSKTSFSYSG